MFSQLDKYQKQIEFVKKGLGEIQERYQILMEMSPDAIVTQCEGKFTSTLIDSSLKHSLLIIM